MLHSAPDITQIVPYNSTSNFKPLNDQCRPTDTICDNGKCCGEETSCCIYGSVTKCCPFEMVVNFFILNKSTKKIIYIWVCLHYLFTFLQGTCCNDQKRCCPANMLCDIDNEDTPNCILPYYLLNDTVIIPTELLGVPRHP